MESPGMFNPSFFSLDNSLSAQAAFDPSHQGLARNHLQVPRQAFTPFTQHAYSPNYSRPQDRQQGSYPSSPSWQLHSRQHQHALPQYGNHYTFGSARQQPFALAHALHAKAAAETKARLDKKHVEILEQEFQRNQKPSSIVKRELAEQMGHEIARINVRNHHNGCFIYFPADSRSRTGSRTDEPRRSPTGGRPSMRREKRSKTVTEEHCRDPGHPTLLRTAVLTDT